MNLVKALGLVSALVLVLIASATHADTIELRSGQLVTGTYAGGSSGSVRFQVGNKTEVFARDKILSITFDSKAPVATTTTAAATAPQSKAPVVIPSGTKMHVKVTQGINTGSSAPGQVFGGVLETALFAKGQSVAPSGTAVYGKLAHVKQGRRVLGQAQIVLVLDSIVIKGKRTSIATQPAAFVDGRRKILGRKRQINIPPGTMLYFTTTKSLSISP
jgi:hypothetical protein